MERLSADAAPPAASQQAEGRRGRRRRADDWISSRAGMSSGRWRRPLIKGAAGISHRDACRPLLRFVHTGSEVAVGKVNLRLLHSSRSRSLELRSGSSSNALVTRPSASVRPTAPFVETPLRACRARFMPGAGSGSPTTMRTALDDLALGCTFDTARGDRLASPRRPVRKPGDVTGEGSAADDQDRSRAWTCALSFFRRGPLCGGVAAGRECQYRSRGRHRLDYVPSEVVSG
jgi:hypothetical protein